MPRRTVSSGRAPMADRPAFGVVDLMLDKTSPFRNPRTVPPQGNSYEPDPDGLTGWVADSSGIEHRVARGCWHAVNDVGACRHNCDEWKALVAEKKSRDEVEANR